MLLWGMILLALIGAAVICAASGAFAGFVWLWLFPISALGLLLVLAALAFGFLWLICRVVDQTKPQEHDSRFYRNAVKLYIDALVRVLRVRIHAIGLEQTPKQGRFLLVCNHTSDADPVVLLHAFRNSQLAFITKRENCTMFLVGKVMHKLLCQPVNRENDREALKTILKCIQLVKDDEVSVAVFPEGYIHPDHKLHHFRHGVFKIATKTKVPIVVCTMKNTLQIFENMPRLKPTDIDLHLLKVIAPGEYEQMTTVELGGWIYDMMAADLGPEHVSEEEL